jgi:hypothetical protein
MLIYIISEYPTVLLGFGGAGGWQWLGWVLHGGEHVRRRGTRPLRLPLVICARPAAGNAAPSVTAADLPEDDNTIMVA